MRTIRRVLASPFRSIANILAMLRYDPDAYGRGSSDRQSGEDTMRHGAVNMNLGDMGNNAI
jgi:hypothetical protein